MPQASVIIPARNKGDILGETLRSLTRQSCPASDFEVILVDDGSEDDTAASLSHADFPFPFTYERLEPEGTFCPARPRNRGLALATGEIALFLDADVLAGPEWVAEHLAAHRAGPEPRAVIGYTAGYPIQPEKRTPEALQPPPPERLFEALAELLARDRHGWCDGREAVYAATDDLAGHTAPWQLFWTNNVSVPRDLALAVGGFDEGFDGWGVEDLEFAYRLHRQGVPFTLARSAWGVHYPHAVGDLEERRRQLARNRRRLIGKHPGPELELRLWNAQAGPEAWPVIASWIDRPASPSGLDDHTARKVASWLRAEIFPGDPLLGCGAPQELITHLQPAALCSPFSTEGADIREQNPPLLGVFTPWEDGTFAGCLVWEYWRFLPPPILEGLLRELSRIAGRVLLACRTEPDRESPAPDERTADGPGTLPVAARGSRWEAIERHGVTAFLLSPTLPSMAARAVGTGNRGDSLMNSTANRRLPSTNGRVPGAASIAAAVARALDERRSIDTLARAVLTRIRERTSPPEDAEQLRDMSELDGSVAPPETATDPAPEEEPDLAIDVADDLPSGRSEAAVEAVTPVVREGPEAAYQEAEAAAVVEMEIPSLIEEEPAEVPTEPSEPDRRGIELDHAPRDGMPAAHFGAHPLVAPLGTRDCVAPWEGRLARKPWEYRVTAVIPHLETPEPLRATVELLRLQTERPYLLVVDTGSSERVKASLEAMRAEDLEVQYISAHGYLHSSEAVGVAQDLAFALCRSKFLFCTHSDCFLRRRDYVEWLLGLCSPDTPVVGYEMSSRDWLTDQWEGMVSHTATLLHMPTMHRLGVSWSFERAHVQFGIPRSSPAWPDTETCMNLVLRQAGVQPLLIGQEENYRRHVDENLDHVRSFPGAQVYAVEYYARAQAWMEEALREAWQRVSLWRAAALRN